MLPSSIQPSLYRVLNGHRLDFPSPTGYYADVYRQQGSQPWECIARHACSPCLDRTAVHEAPRYYVQYRDTRNIVAGRTALVRACPDGFPAPASWLYLS